MSKLAPTVVGWVEQSVAPRNPSFPLAPANPASTGTGFTLPAPAACIRQGWSTSTQVNFCAKAYPTVPQNHPDAPALQVLGDFLRNGYLHRTVREPGGAYGAGAGYHPDSGAFRFFSIAIPA